NYISNASIKFYVEKSWILANSIDPNSIALYRFKDGTWNKLNTSKISENETLLFYFASTPSFSPFAISGEKIGAITPALIPTSTPTPTPTPIAGPAEISPTPTKPAPGFDLMVVIIGVTIATYLWKRKF
ncbi:MAG: PGF-pre-PGF domain-containing protein, partial [Methanocellales archaeon]